MGITVNPNGYYRSYRKINNVEYQLYSVQETEAKEKQQFLDNMAKEHNSLKAPRLFSPCGRLTCLRVTKYKKTTTPIFLLQISVNGKQKTIQRRIKDFNALWEHFLQLWQQYFDLLRIDLIEYRKELSIAKQLYRQDFYRIEREQVQS